MIEGFNVLATNTVMRIVNTNWQIAVAIGCFLAAFIFIIGITFSKNHIKIAVVCIVIAFIISLSLWGLYCIKPDFAYTPVTQYIGTISDEVSYNEFTEKYNIIEVNGQLYTVELKENHNGNS